MNSIIESDTNLVHIIFQDEKSLILNQILKATQNKMGFNVISMTYISMLIWAIFSTKLAIEWNAAF